MPDLEKVRAFAAPFYADKDIMHNAWHIELTGRWVNRLLTLVKVPVNRENLTCALYFHGFIYSHEPLIRQWLSDQGVSPEQTEDIVRIAWESQRPEVPETMEGKILHDAHVLEGGKTYFIVKSLITGSVRGQDLNSTIAYIEKYVLDQNHCYLPEAKALCEQANAFAKDFIRELKAGIAET
ncbi:MAG: hypothetical protein PUC47_00135 [Oscillospiraceae bacterium]|nr:hypothetical protein [Oscillospiraceae bacterium]